MMYIAAVLFVELPVVSGQAALYGQCKWNKSLDDEANNSRRWNGMDWANYMCIWVVLYLLQCLVFSMSSMHWRRSNFGKLSKSFDFCDNTSKLNYVSIHNHMHSSVNVPLDIDRRTGEPDVGVGFAQRLHQRRIQWPASRICDGPRHGIDLRLYELRPLHELV